VISSATDTNDIILHLPPGSADWAGVLTQFTLAIAGERGRQYAAWAADRLLRTTRFSGGLIALRDGALRGILLLEMTEQSAELSFPWTRDHDAVVAELLALAALQCAREASPGIRHIRVERQLLMNHTETQGLTNAGFLCHWRRRMVLELSHWHSAAETPPGFTITPWSIRDLDRAAEVVYAANEGTLDALLYAPFFGDSPAQCRKGLLAILAGRYGPIHPQATLSAFYERTLVGLNLVIAETDGLASVVELSVHPDQQRKGLGRALMARSLRVLNHENMARVELAVTRRNYRAAELYESLGFTDSGEFPVCVYPLPPNP
jgi:ribosomal protein S18 acetylase RimI-like enzyme